MRLIAIDASQTDAARVLALLESHTTHRRLVFGAAAEALASSTRARQQTQDDAFLDAVAAHVLHDDGQDPPERPAAPSALAGVLAVHAAPATLLPLEATECAVELAGAAIAMAVPDRSALSHATVDLANASFWLTGGERLPRMDTLDDVPVISPGHLGPEGGVAVLNVDRRALDVVILNEDGERVASERFAFGGARLSVQGR